MSVCRARLQSVGLCCREGGAGGVGGGGSGEECSEELACTLQVTGQRVKATSGRGSSDLNIWPQVMSF